ncbi:glutathione S-transferase N-terminal domain-containing protein [Novosphingobium colocasiae]
MIELHYVATANGLKVAIMLAELGLPYRVVNYDLFGGQHLTAEFRRINPNSKLPAIIDMAPADGGEPLPVFESGAVLMYLAEKDRTLPAHRPARSRRRAAMAALADGRAGPDARAGAPLRPLCTRKKSITR